MTTYAKQSSESILSTLDKGLHVLEVIANAGVAEGLTLMELSRAVGMHPTTLFRTLATLQSREYVKRDHATDRYRLGTRILSLASTLLKDLDIRQVARPTLQALTNDTQELVHLAVFDDGDVVTVDRLEGKHTISLRTQIGARRPAYCTAAGKAILASLPDGEVDRVLASGMPPVTPRTITSRAVMHEHLAEVRRRGFSWDDEEILEGVRCVAAPVFWYEGRVLGAVSIAAPSLRTPWERLWQLGEQVGAGAREISRQLGYLEVAGDGVARPTSRTGD